MKKFCSVFFCSIRNKTVADCKLRSLRSPKRFFLREISEFAAVERRDLRFLKDSNLTFWQLFQSFWHSKPVILTFFLCFLWILTTFTKPAVFQLEIWEFCHQRRQILYIFFSNVWKRFLRANFRLSSSNFCLISQKFSDEKILQRFFLFDIFVFFCSIRYKTVADCKLWSLRSPKRFFLRKISEFAAVERRE